MSDFIGTSHLTSIMNNAMLCIDWKISDISRFDLNVEILNPTPERLDKGLIFFQWHFNFKGEGGYIGFQLLETGKKAIFSIWQQTKGCMGKPQVEHGKPVYRCLHDYSWKLDKKYRLTVREGEEEKEDQWWIGEIYDYGEEALTTIGKILIPKRFEKLKGYNYYTCLETGYLEDDSMIPNIKAKFTDSCAYINSEEYDLKDALRKFTILMPDKSERSKIIIHDDLSYILEAGGRVAQ